MHTFDCTQFSKYLSGCALLHQNKVEMLPHWFEKDGTISMDKGAEEKKDKLIVRAQGTCLMNLLQVYIYKRTRIYHTFTYVPIQNDRSSSNRAFNQRGTQANLIWRPTTLMPS